MGALVSVHPPKGKRYVRVKKKKRKEKEAAKIHSVKSALNWFYVFVFPFESIEIKLLKCDAD